MAGIWEPNLALASFQIGEEVTVDDLSWFRDKIVVLSCGKWFIVGFVEFQYGSLNEAVNPHKGVIKALTKHGIPLENGLPSLGRVMEPLPKGSGSAQDKDKDKDKDKEGGMGETKPAKPEKVKEVIPPPRDEADLYAEKIGLPQTEVDKFYDHYITNGWMAGRFKMKAWTSSMRNWKRGWEERGRPMAKNGTPKPKSTWELKQIVEAKRGRMKELKDRHYSHFAMGGAWDDASKEAEYRQEKKDAEALEAKMRSIEGITQ